MRGTKGRLFQAVLLVLLISCMVLPAAAQVA